MARKKQQKQRLSPDIVRVIGLMCIFILAVAILALGVNGFLHSSGLFVVRDISLAPSLQPMEIQELLKLRGQNIFDVDLAKVEAKIRQKYPQLSGLRVLRRYPDQLFVMAVRRDPFALAAIDNRVWVVDRNGFVMGSSLKDQEKLPVIKGLKSHRVAAGEAVRDGNIKTGIEVVASFKEDARLKEIVLEAVHVEDPARIVCDLLKGTTPFQIIIDKDHILQRLKTLADVLMRGGVDFEQVKYIEFRFGEPVIGQKKVRK